MLVESFEMSCVEVAVAASSRRQLDSKEARSPSTEMRFESLSSPVLMSNIATGLQLFSGDTVNSAIPFTPIAIMTSSPTFQQLCCELVEDHYGDFYRTIFQTLVGAGRLTAPQVAQKCHLPLRQVKSALVALIQLRLIYHHTPKDGLTIHSANLSNAYDLIRVGKLVEAARERHGQLAATVIMTACDLGFATISEIRDRILHDADSDSQDLTLTTVEEIIDSLLDDHLLVHTRRAHLSEPHDTRRDIELSLLSPVAISKLTGTKAKAEHAENVEAKYKNVIDVHVADHGYTNPSFASTSTNETHGPVNDAILNGHSYRNTVLVQPNFYKIVALSQKQVVKQHAAKIHGKDEGLLLGCAVEIVSSRSYWSRHSHPEFSQLPTDRLLKDANATYKREARSDVPQVNGRSNGHVHHDGYDVMDHDDLERCLMLMTEGTFHWLEEIGGIWQVEQSKLDAWVRKEEVLRVMDSRLGTPAPRIIRILIDKGKLEERTLQEIGLLGAKELRQNLSLLKQMGYLDLQEVPRNPNRQPNQTVFLWSYEPDRVATILLENVYTGILHLLQLLKVERKKIESTLTKIERKDVKGNEKEMLASAEFTMLSRFWKLQDWIWAEIHRLDSTVAILRDS